MLRVQRPWSAENLFGWDSYECQNYIRNMKIATYNVNSIRQTAADRARLVEANTSPMFCAFRKRRFKMTISRWMIYGRPVITLRFVG